MPRCKTARSGYWATSNVDSTMPDPGWWWWTRGARSATPCSSRRRRRAAPAPASACPRRPHAYAMPSPPAHRTDWHRTAGTVRLARRALHPSSQGRPGRVNERRHGGGRTAPHRPSFSFPVRGGPWLDRSGRRVRLTQRMID
jgi:hypothetical protein